MNLKSSTKSEVNTTELVVEIDATEFETAIESIYQAQKKDITMPGFRKGKVPRKLVERTYGANVFYEDAINLLLQTQLPGILAQEELNLVEAPKVEVISADRENGVSLKVICVTKPEIHIADYEGLKAPKKVSEVTDEDVARQLENMQKRNARIVSVDDRAAQMGDEVELDFEGYFGEEPFDGGKGENYQLKLGSGQFIPGFEDQVAGHTIDEDFDVTVTFPENYQMEDYAGKEAVFKCKIRSISAEELPELDDDFAKDTSEFDTLDEVKADIRKNLEEQAQQSADTAFENSLVMSLIEKVTDPIPHCMFEQRADDLMERFAGQLKQQGVSMELYLQYTGMDEDSLKATYLDRAENEVKLRLALEQIAKQENLEVTEEELDESLKEVAESNHLTVDQVKQRIPMEEYKLDHLVTKAMDFVKAHAIVDNTIAEEPEAEPETEPETEAAAQAE